MKKKKAIRTILGCLHRRKPFGQRVLHQPWRVCKKPSKPSFSVCLQIYPHTSFADEVDFLDTVFTGKAYVHGPLNGDRWYTYVADDGKRPTIITADRTLNIMMYGLEPEVAQNFFKSEKVCRSTGFCFLPSVCGGCCALNSSPARFVAVVGKNREQKPGVDSHGSGVAYASNRWRRCTVASNARSGFLFVVLVLDIFQHAPAPISLRWTLFIGSHAVPRGSCGKTSILP